MQSLLNADLANFWAQSPAECESALLSAIAETHAWHYERNRAYQRTVAARGVGSAITPADFPHLLRPTAQTFKSYIEILGTPFPQEQPRAFLSWLDDQLSIPLPQERFAYFRPRYPSLESLLRDIERIFADKGLEVLTSSGTSGRYTIMVRDQKAIDRTTESFYLSFQRYMGMQADHRMIFVMPSDSRIAMVRMATFSVKRVGVPDNRIHFTIPFPALPDQVRIRSGRTYYPGWRGMLERKLEHPFMVWMNDHYVTPQSIRLTIKLLQQSEAAGDKILLFGGWAQLHAIAQTMQARGIVLRMAPGSLIGSGGGLKEWYPTPVSQIQEDLRRVFTLADGQPLPIRDVYGMAEANWVAMQCGQGNYHVPPWVYAAVLDDSGQFQQQPDSIGLLAFLDPYSGGQLFPSFFRTADRVRLINSSGSVGQHQTCPCGEIGTYIVRDSIQRVDLLDEAGCAAQV